MAHIEIDDVTAIYECAGAEVSEEEIAVITKQCSDQHGDCRTAFQWAEYFAAQEAADQRTEMLSADAHQEAAFGWN